jgi:hypothetical protein
LQEAFINHYDETEEQVARLEKVFEAIGKRARGKTCDAILGIVVEGQKLIDEVDDEVLRDAGIIAAAQAAEHYEIARYGTLRAWAELLPRAKKFLRMIPRGPQAQGARSSPAKPIFGYGRRSEKGGEVLWPQPIFFLIGQESQQPQGPCRARHQAHNPTPHCRANSAMRQ